MNSLVSIALLACRLAEQPAASTEPAATEGGPETRYAVSLAEEGSFARGLRVPGPSAGNLLLLQPSFAYRQGQR